MRYAIYFLIGLGFTLSDPYAGLPMLQRFGIYLAWPAIVTRDVINEIGRQTPAKGAR